MSPRRPLGVAIVGAGPAGLYAAESLLLSRERVSARIDVLDRLPTPYGLVRYGVAPDHATIKSVVSSLRSILQHRAVRFLGNVDIGSDIRRADLKACYDAVIYATGAPSDRRLKIPGEDLEGSISATEFVAWYNGHPDAVPDGSLHAADVVVIGAGNVALDISRILTRPFDDLARTDIPSAVLGRLRTNGTRQVHLLARRGPEHAKFSTKELRELGAVDNVKVVVDAADLDGVDEQAMTDRRVLANLKLFRQWSANPLQSEGRTVAFRFFASPVEILGSGRVEAVRVERMTVQSGDASSISGTGHYEVIPAGMVVRAVGYRGVGIDGLPFDAARGVVPNTAGRVDAADAGHGGREYVAGWLKRGPNGVIGTNKVDAKETVESLLDDYAAGLLGDSEAMRPAFDDLLRTRGVGAVSFAGWEAIDGAEAARGVSEGRARSKISDWQTLRQLGLAASSREMSEERESV